MQAEQQLHATRPASVRAAEKSDLSAVLELVNSLTPGIHAGHASVEDIERFSRILAQPMRRVFIAEMSDLVVGTLDVVVCESLSRHGRSWAILEHFAVAESSQGHGVGRTLLDAAVTFAEAAGCYKVQLVSGTERRRAHGLFEDYGFTEDVSGFRRFLAHPGDG